MPTKNFQSNAKKLRNIHHKIATHRAKTLDKMANKMKRIHHRMHRRATRK